MWWRSRLLTAQFSATIAIGMGAAAALVSLLLALGYQPLPYRDPGRLVAVWERAESGAQVIGISGPDLADFSDATHGIFATLGGFVPAPLWMFDTQGATKIGACYIHESVFSDLGIRPVLGREVRPDDEPVGPESAGDAGVAPAWISYEFWQRRYGGSPSVMGATIGISGSATASYKTRVRIAGVLPRRVSIPLPFNENSADVWYILERNSAARDRQAASFFGLGRLRPGITVAQAEAALAVVAERLGQRYTFDRRKRPAVLSLEAIAQGPVRQTMGLLVLGVALVFLVGCVNLAILMGAEGRRRSREIAIRVALGASRSRLWCEAASEKCLLTLLSLGLGVAFAPALLRVLAWLVPTAGLGPPLLDPPPLNLAVLLGFAAFALAAALIWSALLVSAATAGGPGASRALSTSGGPGYTGFSDRSPRAGRWWLILPAAQAGTGICLLAAAAMTAGAYVTRSTANLGPDPRHTVLVSLSGFDSSLDDAPTLELDRQLLSRFQRLPGTQAIALADYFPPIGSPVPFLKQGDAAGIQRSATYPISVSPGYFRALGIPILYGRGFDDTDNLRSEKVAIISLDMAERNWTSPKDSVGSQINYGSKFQHRYKIAGVVANFTGYWSEKPFPMVYLPEAQSANGCGTVILRTTASTRTIAALAPQTLAGMANPQTITEVATMQWRWQSTLTRPLARMAGMLLIGLLGLALCVQGVYAVAAGTVAARGHELAVRCALGAPPSQMAWNVTRGLVLSVTAGATLGVSAAFALRPLLEQWIGATTAWQLPSIAAAVVLLAMAAAAGCWFPVRAAMRTDPVELLRQG
jgi:predicted permease